nr:BrnT family toxin [Steroidobacter denitrificans]
MGFEYDPDKSSANQLKHGIDFTAAQALWNDPTLIEIQPEYPTSPAESRLE